MARSARSSRDAGIEVEGLVRRFKDVEAVAGIDLQVAPGEIYGFLGPNGAGKSTTVHMLTTLLPPTAGRASVAGFDVVKEGPKVRAAIGAALQEAALDQFLTGREHLNLQSSLHGLSRLDKKRRADELLERVGLTLAALKAEIGRPTVEVIPADPAQREAVARTLELFGTPTTGAPGAVAVRVERESDLSDIVRALDAEDLHSAHVQLHAPSLDDVFLAKTGRSLEGATEEAEQTVTA